MENKKVGRVALAALIPILFILSVSALGQENDDCLACHNIEGLKLTRNGRDISLYVDAERLAASMHADFDCISCHTELDGVEDYPHAKGLPRVQCTECHDDDDGPIAAYWNSTHGKEAGKSNELAPLCQDCHGSHYILPLSDPNSAISPFKIPAMCAHCHAEDAPVARAYDLVQEQVVERYRQSIHGYGLFKQGLTVTAVCTSCHTGHNVLPHDDIDSTIHKDMIVGTCMQCHGQIEEVHRKKIAGELWEAEGVVPICVECHAPHEARKVFYDTNMSNRDCLSCHTDPSQISEPFDLDSFEHAVHARHAVACAQCHTGVTPSIERSCQPITDAKLSVDCSICHEAEVSDYGTGIHGRLHSVNDPNAPACIDCHGKHGMLEHAVPEEAGAMIEALVRESPTFRRNVPALCAGCHREGAPAARRYLGAEDKVVEHYTMSIHGRGLIESGLTVTAICTDCHTAHRELPHTDENSSVGETNIAATCGRCHDGIYEKYQISVHSDSETGNPDYVQLRGMSELPHCNDCHTSHTMARTDLPDFMLGIIDQCGKCHEDVTDTYFDTYHGKASELGDTTKAKCYDCHGAHEILPITDPRSNLHRDNIVETCARCHPGSHRQFAGYLTHATHHDPDKYPALYYTFWGMTILLIVTFSFFGLHMLAWIPRSWKLRMQHKKEIAAMPRHERQYRRFPRFQRGLHITVIISFFGLAITGMMLKFSYTPWALFLSKILGGAWGAGLIHRICALATFGYFFAHLWDVFRRYFASKKPALEFFYGGDTILPKFSDLKELGATFKWFLGKGPMPRYGRWTYWEKFDYFAVFWGVAVIGSTGLTLWFPELFTRIFPGWSINVATIIHSDEALLATGFIFTVHFFNTHFRPEKFPMDPVIFTGRMSQRELKHDRPRLYERLVETGELEQHLVAPFPEFVTRVIKSIAYVFLAIGVTLILLIIYAMLFQYR